MHTIILNLVFHKQCIPICSGQSYGHLQVHKLQRQDILKVKNEILKISKPMQSGNYNNMK